MTSAPSQVAPVVARPRRIRLLVFVFAPIIVVVFTLISFSLHGTINDQGAVFETADHWAMIILGVVVALVSLIFARPSVRADAEGIRVQNLLGSYDVPWSIVRAVKFNRGSSWAMLDLHDDDVLAVLAVQAADKEYAVDVVRRLRALHAAAQQKRPEEPTAPETVAQPSPADAE
ncbi:PH domain-containing protein [Virgisporangium aliadipatigenens]|nr:PH domain-containing protein [Virgisporangium aliadipatigenens]